MKTVSLQILFVLGVLCLVIPAAGQPKAPLKCSTECGRFTAQIAAKRIRSYRRTEPHCRKQAVILTTLKSMEICADPQEDWVKKIVETLDQKKPKESSLPHDPSLAAAPEEPGVFQKHVGLTATAPSRATAATNFFQRTNTTVLGRLHGPAARMEASSKSPPAVQNTTPLPAGLSRTIWEIAAHSEVSSEANRESLKSPAPSITFAVGLGSSQPTLHPTALVHGFDEAVGPMEEPAGHAANTAAYVQDVTPPTSNSYPVGITKGSDHPVLSINESLDITSARGNTPDTASSSSSSGLPSILDSTEITTVPATPVPPEISSVSTLNPTGLDEDSSAHTNKVARTSAHAFSTRIFDFSSSVRKQDPSNMLVFTSQAFSGQARAQVTTERPNNLPLPSFLSRSQMHFVIPVSLVGGLMACSVAAVWLYLKFGIKAEETSTEMVQGLLYRNDHHQKNAYPMEVI